MAFPEQPAWQEESITHWHDEADAVQSVESFLERVEGLFPVLTEIWEYDLEIIEWPLYQIPIQPLGYNIWYDGWDDLLEPAPYLLHMTWSREQAGRPIADSEFDTLYPDFSVPRYLEPQRLIDNLRHIWREDSQQSKLFPLELEGLPDLILMLHGSSNNLWLDVGEIELAEGGGSFMWSRENVAMLAQEWQEAKPVYEGILRLLDWNKETETAVAEKLTAVRHLLLAAYERSRENVATTPTTAAAAA